MSEDTIVARIRSNVRTYGWHCLTVLPRLGEGGAEFTYTIGLSETFAHPELMIFDLSSSASHGILSGCVEMIRNGTRFRPGPEYPDVLAGDYNVAVKQVREECMSEYFGSAMRYYGDQPFSGLVMFWPDKEHRFPWQDSASAEQQEALSIVER